MFIESWEVQLNSSAKAEMDVKWFENIIDSIEFDLISEVFGEDIYYCLITKKTDYGNGDPENVVCEFMKNKVYVDGNYVRYKDRIYKAIVTTTAGDLPIDETKFTLQKRFTTDFLNKVWNDHLKGIFAYKVAAMSVVPSTYQLGTLGVTTLKDEVTGHQGAAKGEVMSVIDNYERVVHSKIKFLKSYLDRYPGTDMDCWVKVNDCCEDGVSTNNPVYNGRKFILRNRRE